MNFSFIQGMVEKAAGSPGQKKKGSPGNNAAESGITGEAGFVLDHLPMAVYWKDTNSVYRGGNSLFLRMAGLSRDELEGKTDFDLHSRETAERFRQEDIELASGSRKGLYFTDKFIQAQDSRGVWARTYKIPVFDGEGKLQYIIGIIQDVTKVKNTELALDESEAKLKEALDASSDIILLVDGDGKILTANSEFVKIFSPERASVTGMRVSELIPLPLYEKAARVVRAARGRGAPANFLITPGETPLGRYYDLSLHPVRTREKDSFTAVFAKDITELKLTEAMLLQHSSQLQEAMVEAEQASKAKSDFLSKMSHEIRTPLNAIIGMARIAGGTDELEKIKECLVKIDSSSRHLLGIINDVLDMSKIEAGDFTLSDMVFRFEEMLSDVANVISVQAGEMGQEFEVILDTSMPEFFNADESRLRQVLLNLLSNAVKFTPEGGKIKIEANHLAFLGDYSLIEVTVSDNGIGISPEQQDRLFQAFEQAEGGIDRRYGGTGLGLAICKKIVEMMDGRIRIESEPGKGSRFTFNVKLKNHDTGKNSVYPAIGFKDMRALIVDDSLETREYLSAVLDKFGVRSETASGGMESIQKAEHARSMGTPFNVFFVDWAMPGIDGIETTRRIKSLMSDNAVVIMISITEWEKIGDEAMEAGVSRFMAKPLFPSAVLGVLSEIAGSSSVEDIKIDESGVPDLTGYRILIAEDIEINREIAAAVLEATNAEIDFAVNGKTAVEMFRSGMDRYDLILMDIHMPEMDGYEATRLIREGGDEISANIPIVAMTADAFKEDIEKCRSIGMNDHVAKPINEKELFQKVQICRLSPRKKASRPHGRPRRNADGTPPLVINESEALKRLGGNETLYERLLRAFLTDSSLTDFAKSARENDSGGALAALHSIKGMAANLSLDALYFAAEKAEKALNTGESLTSIAPGFEDKIEITLTAVDKKVEAIASAPP